MKELRKTTKNYRMLFFQARFKYKARVLTTILLCSASFILRLFNEVLSIAQVIWSQTLGQYLVNFKDYPSIRLENEKLKITGNLG
jgi:hypothetical protein